MSNSESVSGLEEGVTCTGLFGEYTLADVGKYSHPASFLSGTSAIQELCYHLRSDVWYAQRRDDMFSSIYLASAIGTCPAYLCVQLLRQALSVHCSLQNLLHLDPFLDKRLPPETRPLL